jgi:hypothetical protein
VLPNAALVKKAAKTAAVGLPTRRKTTNVRETQIDGVEIARKMPATDVRHHQKRCDNLVFFCYRIPLSRSTLRETQKKSERKRNADEIRFFQFQTGFGEARVGRSSRSTVVDLPTADDTFRPTGDGQRWRTGTQWKAGIGGGP